MTDSPALNLHSRSVLIPLTPTQLPPGVVTVPGPGPNEVRNDVAPITNGTDSDGPPPVQPKRTDVQTEEEDDEAGSEQDDDDDDDNTPAIRDPYSNLDSAFGNYVTDQPRPMAANKGGGRSHDEDDLLF